MARSRTFHREQAVEKALQLFWEHGFAATSIEMLSERTGVGRQSLYDTFGDKRGLYLHALERYADQHVAWVQGALMRSGSVRKAVREIFEGIARHGKSARLRGCFLVNTACELAPHDSDVADAVGGGFRALEDAFTQALERGRSTGELERHGDARATARMLVTVMNGMYAAGKAGTPGESLTDVARSAVALVR